MVVTVDQRLSQGLAKGVGLEVAALRAGEGTYVREKGVYTVVLRDQHEAGSTFSGSWGRPQDCELPLHVLSELAEL